MTDVIIGLGEIGYPLWKLCVYHHKKTYGYDIDPAKIPEDNPEAPESAEILHICIPYSDHFIDMVHGFIKWFSPKGVIIHSTVPPGTSDALVDQLSMQETCDVAHSPVNGKHANMTKDMIRYPKYVGYALIDNDSVERWLDDVCSGGVRVLLNAKHSEWAKLLSTTFFGWQIAFYQEVERIALQHGLQAKDLTSIIDELDASDYTPPFFSGVIGGHCVMQNTQLLQDHHPSIFWELLRISNHEKVRLESQRNPTV